MDIWFATAVIIAIKKEIYWTFLAYVPFLKVCMCFKQSLLI